MKSSLHCARNEGVHTGEAQKRRLQRRGRCCRCAAGTTCSLTSGEKRKRNRNFTRDPSSFCRGRSQSRRFGRTEGKSRSCANEHAAASKRITPRCFESKGLLETVINPVKEGVRGTRFAVVYSWKAVVEQRNTRKSSLPGRCGGDGAATAVLREEVEVVTREALLVWKVEF